MWRIVSSPRFNVSLIEVQTLWSMEDVFDAHLTLDLHEDAETIASRGSRT